VRASAPLKFQVLKISAKSACTEDYLLEEDSGARDDYTRLATFSAARAEEVQQEQVEERERERGERAERQAQQRESGGERERREPRN
jgi:hypothetical protein